jgi:hypothetical protein
MVVPPQLSEAFSSFQRLNRKAHKLRLFPQHPVHEEMGHACNGYSQLIKTTKKNLWKDWLDNAVDQAIWQVNKFIESATQSGIQLRLPNLKNPMDNNLSVMTTNEDKSCMLHTVFFPPPSCVPTFNRDTVTSNTQL